MSVLRKTPGLALDEDSGYKKLKKIFIHVKMFTWTLTAKDENNLRLFRKADTEEDIWSCHY